MITPAQREILGTIQALSLRGYSCSIRELMAETGISSLNGIKCHLRPLRSKGLVDWVDGQSRTLHLLDGWDRVPVGPGKALKRRST